VAEQIFKVRLAGRVITRLGNDLVVDRLSNVKSHQPRQRPQIVQPCRSYRK
jgi:hypothetical protein